MVGAKNCALVALVACLPAALLAAPATAAPTASMITHPQDDWAGSQIAIHEGRRSAAAIGADAISQPAASGPHFAGLDVSSHQGKVNWASVAANDGMFGYVKATEGSTYVNPYFAQQYNGSYAAGLVRGAYHFATPNTSGGANQANWFLGHGGNWSADGKTLPPALDLEYNPYGASCYGLSAVTLVAWVRAFVSQVHTKTGVWPTIYTSTSWWKLCMGNNASFGADPLWIARYNSVLGALPPGWQTWAIWQFADAGKLPGDQDEFNGTVADLRALANG
ncbi:MAG TPA: lysozyme [Pseudonocardiaceae bacterium]|nr:lysozyme [Pseudonocardiaceae bacterium]